jgi:hypothetical protein
MLAEVFLLRLEAIARASRDSASPVSNSPFVPISLPLPTDKPPAR